MRTNETEILSKFKNIVVHSLRVDPDRVTPNAHLMDDLGAESLDLIEITMEVETAFNVCIPEKSILDTAIEVFGPGVLERDGFLTAEGKALLRERLGNFEGLSVDGPIALADLRAVFMTVGAWVRMIEHLVICTPATCEQCNGGMTADLGSRMKCSSCGATVAIPAGEDINREWVLEYYQSLADRSHEGERALAVAAAGSFAGTRHERIADGFNEPAD